MLSRPRAQFIAASILAFLSIRGPAARSIAATTTQDNPKLSLTPAPIPAGLVGWWPGELGPQDQMGQSDGEMKGSLSFREGEVSMGFYYSNIIGYVKVPPLADLQDANGLTIECWIRPSAEAEYPIVDWNDGAGHLGTHFWVFSGKGRLFLNVIDTQRADHAIASGPGIIKTDVFQHIAATYDGETGIARLYRDGVLMAENDLGKFKPQTSYPVYFGHRPDEERKFMGLIDEVSIYNRALTPEEIQSIYRAGSAGKGLTTAKATP